MNNDLEKAKSDSSHKLSIPGLTKKSGGLLGNSVAQLFFITNLSCNILKKWYSVYKKNQKILISCVSQSGVSIL